MGYDREYTRKLKTFRDKWWDFDRHGNKIERKRSKPKGWQDLEFYKNDPKRAAFRAAWEKGERDFTVLWHLAND